MSRIGISPMRPAIRSAARALFQLRVAMTPFSTCTDDLVALAASV
jgi:hypothetical protein